MAVSSNKKRARHFEHVSRWLKHKPTLVLSVSQQLASAVDFSVSCVNRVVMRARLGPRGFSAKVSSGIS